MKHSILIKSALLGLCSIAASPAAVLAQPNNNPWQMCGDAACGQVVVQLRPQASIEGINATFGTTTIRSIPSRGLHLLQIPPQATVQVMQAMLGGDARVAWAELNYMVIAPSGGTQSFFLSASLKQFIGQEQIALIEADPARALSTGRGQIVAVLDTGVDPVHVELTGSIAPGGYNYIGGNTDYRDIGNGLDDNGNQLIDEMVGHGTMTAGLILRVAPEARILPLRVLNCDGVGASFYVAQAMYDAIDRGATVINASFGTIRPSQLIADAAQAAVDRGIVVVAAAGNFNRAEPRSYPAAFESVIAVAGTDVHDRKAPFSDYGAYIDLCAPAVNISGPVPNDLYAMTSGNSAGAALVSGAAAVVRSHEPSLTPLQVRERLRRSSDHIGTVNPGFHGLLGSGRLNVRNAVLGPDHGRSR